MGLDRPETCRRSRNILRISCTSGWVSFTRLYRDAGSIKYKKIDEVVNKNQKYATLQKKTLKHNVEAWLFKNVNGNIIKIAHQNL